MEILVITVWFCAMVCAATALAVALVVRAVRADTRDVARYERPERRAVETELPQLERLAA